MNPSRIDDPRFVHEQYEDAENLAARKSAYANAEGPDPREIAWRAIAEAKPQRVLEVGGGEGELAERIVRVLGAELVGVDQSAGMVEIQRSKGIEARIGDVQELPFEDGEFDLAVAAWMLYHVPDPERALRELARVLKPAGRLVAVTNGVDHFREFQELAAQDPVYRTGVFSRENGEALLEPHFVRVERYDADGWVTMDDEAIRRYAASWELFRPILDLPRFDAPLRIRRAPTIFVADKALGARGCRRRLPFVPRTGTDAYKVRRYAR